MLAALRFPTTVRRFYLVSACLILLAWGLLIAWQRSAFAGLLGHEAVGEQLFPSLARLALFLLGWLLMTVAMMLPGSLPRLNQVVAQDRSHIAKGLHEWLLLLGYLSPWVLFGLLGYLGDGFLHRLAAPGAPLAAVSGFIPPALLLLAGLYQFTPFKRYFLDRCQVGEPFCRPGELGRPAGPYFWSQGLEQGLFCVGSCWSLMLLMFALGPHSPGWMLALGGVMAAERLAPWGRRFAWLVGFALLVWAVLWVLESAHGGHSHG
jgi:predicted metal-binding membrane protein